MDILRLKTNQASNRIIQRWNLEAPAECKKNSRDMPEHGKTTVEVFQRTSGPFKRPPVDFQLHTSRISTPVEFARRDGQENN